MCPSVYIIYAMNTSKAIVHTLPIGIVYSHHIIIPIVHAINACDYIK